MPELNSNLESLVKTQRAMNARFKGSSLYFDALKSYISNSKQTPFKSMKEYTIEMEDGFCLVAPKVQKMV